MNILLAVFLCVVITLAFGVLVVIFVNHHDRREAEAFCSVFGHSWRNIYGDEINHLSCRAVCVRCGERSAVLR